MVGYGNYMSNVFISSRRKQIVIHCYSSLCKRQYLSFCFMVFLRQETTIISYYVLNGFNYNSLNRRWICMLIKFLSKPLNNQIDCAKQFYNPTIQF